MTKVCICLRVFVDSKNVIDYRLQFLKNQSVMSKLNEHDLYGTNFSIESMKVIAESIGIGYLADDAAKELAEDMSFRLKHIIQDAAKFMNHAKRVKLMQSDVDAALKAKNIEVSISCFYFNNYF